MSITADSLKERQSSLQECLKRSLETHEDLKDRMKNLKKEIANTKGALIEIDHLLENYS